MIGRFLLLGDSCFDFGFRLGDRRQPHLATLELLGDRHPIRHFGRIGPLGKLQQLLHFAPEGLLELARVAIGQGAVTAGVRMHFGAIKRHRPELEHPHRARKFQHVHEQRLDVADKRLRKAAIVS